MRYLSPSLLNQASKCSASYNLIKATPVNMEALERGKRIHEKIEDYLKSGNSDTEIHDLVTWIEEIHPDMTIPEEIEHKFKVIIKDMRESGVDVGISGRIDALYSDCVVDWKTGKGYHLPPLSHDLQMAAYAIGTGRWRVRRVMVDDLEFREHEYTPEEMNSLKETIYEVGCSVLSPEYTYGPHCQGCLANHVCPKVKEITTTVPIPWGGGKLSSSDALTLARAIGPASTVLRKAKDHLRQHVAEYGPIYDPKSGLTYDIVNQKFDTVLDSVSIIEEMRDDGLDPIVSLNKSDIERSFKHAGLNARKSIEKYKENGWIGSVSRQILKWRRGK